MIEKQITVINKLGLHARASARLVQALSPFKSQVQLSFRGREINAKSIMGLMMLAAAQGSVLILRVTGEDEIECTAAIESLFGQRFGETE